MHIVLISRECLPTLRGGGIASYIKEISEGYTQLGHQVTIICASDNTNLSSDKHINGIRVIRLSGGDFVIPSIEGKSIIKKLRPFYRFHSYRKKIRKVILGLDNIDIIEVPEFGAESIYLHDLAIPIVLRLHTAAYTDRNTAGKKEYSLFQIHHRYLAEIEKKEVQRTTNITSCSQSLKDWSVKFFHINPNNIKVIYNPIQTQYWQNEIVTNRCNNNQAYQVLYAGTVAEGKGIQDLIEACILIKQEHPEITLSIAGKLGKYGNELKEKYESLKWCTFLGNLPREELKRTYIECNVACFPSWWEAMGLVCTEAMACGCIVIGSESGGMSEIIENDVDGFLTPPQNPNKLAKIIQRTILLTDEERMIISKNAQRKIRERFSIESILNEMINYYNQTINTYRLK